MQTARRSLAFTDLDQVVAELDRLLAHGYTQTGNWDLAQICGHLNDWMRYSIDGYPTPPLPIRAALWAMKITIGRRQLQRVLEKGFQDRLPTMPATVPEAGRRTDAAGVAMLTETIQRLQNHTGPIHPSPLYGSLTRDEAVRLQLVHCAHHLSFLEPRA